MLYNINAGERKVNSIRIYYPTLSKGFILEYRKYFILIYIFMIAILYFIVPGVILEYFIVVPLIIGGIISIWPRYNGRITIKDSNLSIYQKQLLIHQISVNEVISIEFDISYDWEIYQKVLKVIIISNNASLNFIISAGSSTKLMNKYLKLFLLLVHNGYTYKTSNLEFWQPYLQLIGFDEKLTRIGD